MDKISFSTDSRQDLHINDKLLGNIWDWGYFGESPLRVKNGGMVSIVAEENNLVYGAVVGLQIGREHYVTKVGNRPWRATVPLEAGITTG